MQSDLLDTFIGVVFVWFLLSTFLAAVNEGVALLLRARAKHLWYAIAHLVDPDRNPMSARLRDSPLLFGRDVRPAVPGTAVGFVRKLANTLRERFVGPPDPAAPRTRAIEANVALYRQLAPGMAEIARVGNKTKVTRVASGLFSQAVASVATTVTPGEIHEGALRAGWSRARARRLRDALPATGEAGLTEADVAGVTGDDLGTEAERVALYRAAAAGLTLGNILTWCGDNPELLRAVQRAATAADAVERVAAARKVVEGWFEAKMDQLSALYRRKSRKLLAWFAIPLVLFTHANAIAIFESLRQDAALRQATVSAAVNAASEDSIQEAMEQSCPEPAAAPATTTTTDPVAAAVDRFKCGAKIVGRAGEFQVGLAWEELKSASGVDGTRARFDWHRDVWAYLGDALWDDWGIFGRGLTWLALLFGAQFWFDVMRRLTGVRAALTGGSAKEPPK